MECQWFFCSKLLKLRMIIRLCLAVNSPCSCNIMTWNSEKWIPFIMYLPVLCISGSNPKTKRQHKHGNKWRKQQKTISLSRCNFHVSELLCSPWVRYILYLAWIFPSGPTFIHLLKLWKYFLLKVISWTQKKKKKICSGLLFGVILFVH